MKKYYYQKEGETYGPILIDDIVKVIDENTLVSDSSKEWKTAKEIPEILALLVALGVVKSTIKKVPPPPPPTVSKTPPPPPSSNTLPPSSNAIPFPPPNNTNAPPANKSTNDFNTPPKQFNVGSKNNSKKGIGVLPRLVILGVLAALIFYGADLYNEKKQADEREYNKEHGIKVVGQGNDDSHSNNKEDDEYVGGSSKSQKSNNAEDEVKHVWNNAFPENESSGENQERVLYEQCYFECYFCGKNYFAPDYYPDITKIKSDVIREALTKKMIAAGMIDYAMSGIENIRNSECNSSQSRNGRHEWRDIKSKSNHKYMTAVIKDDGSVEVH